MQKSDVSATKAPRRKKGSSVKAGKFLSTLLALVLSFALLPGCSNAPASKNATPQQPAQEQTQANAPANKANEDAAASTSQSSSPEVTEPASLSLDDVPEYSGKPYTEALNNVPQFTEEDKQRSTFEEYSNLDSLGRCGVAFALISEETMPTEKRGSIGEVKPSGWHTIRYNGVIEGNYLYNRCHLIGYQLAGENANPKNLITGTRYLNTEGMLPFENEVAEYVESTGNHVLYRVTPIFDGSNLVASGVQMEALSLEDDGKGISFDVYCYDVQPEINIDYATGDSSLEESSAADPETTPAEQSYILNTNTKKFHAPGCSSIGQIKESNKKTFTGTRDNLISQGYTPCRKCNP